MTNLGFIRRALMLAASSALVACGGGGGGPAPVVGPVASTSIFQFRDGWINSVNLTSTQSFGVSGTLSGQAVTGSGTVTRGAVSNATFEGIAGLQKSSTVVATIRSGSTSVPFTYTSTGFYGKDYLPLGATTATSYSVVSGPVTMPTTVRVNDTAPLFTYKTYSSSAKIALVETVSVSYVLLPDTANTALLKLTYVTKNASGAQTSQSIVTLRMTPSGTVTPIDETGITSTDNLTFTYL